MQTFVTVSGIAFQIGAVIWMVFFYLKFLRPVARLYGFTWRDAMIGMGFFLNIGVFAAIPVLFGIRLHPIILVALGLLAFHAWMKFWVRRPHRTTER